MQQRQSRYIVDELEQHPSQQGQVWIIIDLVALQFYEKIIPGTLSR
jgi:hypothetical protein